MPAASDYVTGTISLTNGSNNFTGTSTGWLLAGFKEGDTIIDITGATEYMGVIATIDANGAGTLTKAWEGPTLSNVAYRMRYQPDGARVSAQARNLIELLGNGNVLALAGLSGSANQVPMFTGPGAMTLVPKTDLVSGADYDVQVADLAARAAYDAQAEGYSVLVADTGDGRAAIYSKVSATSGDWSDPAYVTGPIGPLPDVTIGTVTTGDPGSAAQVTATPTVDGVELDFTIPAGEGFAFQGAYSGATTYVLGDVAQESGSSWILTVAESTGNAPPTLPTTSNAYWQLLARQGIDGAGTVNSVEAGVGIAVDNTDPTAPLVSAPTAVRFDAQALDAAQKGQVRANIGADVLAGFRNKIINGNFDIWNRGDTFVTSGFCADRWTYGFGGGTGQIVRTEHALGDAYGQNYLRFVQTTGAALPFIAQKIEDVRTFSGKQATLSWYGATTAQISPVIRQYFGSGGSALLDTTPIAKGTRANGLHWATFDIPSIGGKTAGANSYLEAILFFPANQTFDLAIWRVSLVEGDATAEADPFSPRHIQQELALCQRYYEERKFRRYLTGAIWNTTGGIIVQEAFCTPKRVTPTVILSNAETAYDGIWTGRTATGPAATPFEVAWTINYGGSTSAYDSIICSTFWTADAEL